MKNTYSKKQSPNSPDLPNQEDCDGVTASVPSSENQALVPFTDKKEHLQKIRDLVPTVSADHLRPPEGVPTGVAHLDRFLLWQGLPKGDLSLFQGLPGTGATSVWVQTLKQVHQQNKWAAWINGEAQIFPSHLQNHGINLKKLLVMKQPQDAEQLFWILQELITSSLFEVIGCNLKEMFLKNHQLQKLKKLCRLHKVALILINPQPLKFVNPLFSLSILFQRDFVTIQRALHRPTPYQLSGSMIHANLMHQFKNTSRKLLG